MEKTKWEIKTLATTLCISNGGKVLKMNNIDEINNSAIMNKSAENPATTHTHNR